MRHTTGPVVVTLLMPGLLLALTGCIERRKDRPPQARSTSQTPPLRTLSVCEAAKLPARQRIRVAGEFDGLDYGRGRMASILSGEVCSERGAGVIFAHLRSDAEKKKVGSLMPRTRKRSGDSITVEGVIQKVEDGRFVTLTDVVVVSR